jgi:WD40 repeat protein
MAWHQQQPLLVTGCLDGVVRCWDLRTASCVRTMEGHSSGVQDVALSADGAFVLSGADDNAARVFSLT